MPERSLSIRSPIFAVAQHDSTDWLPERLPARSPPVSSARSSLMSNSTGHPSVGIGSSRSTHVVELQGATEHRVGTRHCPEDAVYAAHHPLDRIHQKVDLGMHLAHGVRHFKGNRPVAERLQIDNVG